ncbi:M23 family metallopeptidase [Oerskovia paurometabola]|uniref:M23 family metallopeptidase n=1 Tax=Oerskovia paurometabola TaxID=162170 RepID=UPI00342D8CD5
MRTHPITGEYTLHAGTDIGAPAGAPVWAAADGTVAASGFDPGGGNMIRIAHPGGIETWYLHLTASLVTKGATVTAGQQIATAGSTGNATGPHLHFETRVGGTPQDPVPFMTARGITLGVGTPTPPTPNPGGFLMALTETQQQQIYDVLLGPNGSEKMTDMMPFGQNLPTSIATSRNALQELLDRTAPVMRGGPIALRQEIADTKTAVLAIKAHLGI